MSVISGKAVARPLRVLLVSAMVLLLWMMAAQAVLARAPLAAIVVDARTGEVLFARNADAQRYPASISKVMTLYLLFREIRAGRLSLNSRLKVSRRAAAMQPSKLYLKPGQSITVDQAIRALAVKSANDVAAVVAENIAGSEAAFARRMTLMARALGMTRTTFRNASGLPTPPNVSTARDLATLSLRLMRDFPRFYKRYFGLKTFTWRGRRMRNHNHLLWRVAGMDGIKTGYTRAAGSNLAASVRRGGKRIVAVVLSAPSSRFRNAYMARLIEQSFRRYRLASGTRIASLAGTPPGWNPAQVQRFLARLQAISRPVRMASRERNRPPRPRVRKTEVVIIPARGQARELAKLALLATETPPVHKPARRSSIAATSTATAQPRPVPRPARLRQHPALQPAAAQKTVPAPRRRPALLADNDNPKSASHDLAAPLVSSGDAHGRGAKTALQVSGGKTDSSAENGARLHVSDNVMLTARVRVQVPPTDKGTRQKEAGQKEAGQKEARQKEAGQKGGMQNDGQNRQLASAQSVARTSSSAPVPVQDTEKPEKKPAKQQKPQASAETAMIRPRTTAQRVAMAAADIPPLRRQLTPNAPQSASTAGDMAAARQGPTANTSATEGSIVITKTPPVTNTSARPRTGAMNATNNTNANKPATPAGTANGKQQAGKVVDEDAGETVVAAVSNPDSAKAPALRQTSASPAIGRAALQGASAHADATAAHSVTAARKPLPAEEIIIPSPQRAHALMQAHWLIQIGAFPTLEGAREYLRKARRVSRNVQGRQMVVIRVRRGGKVFYRARYAGMSRRQAIRACRELKRRGLSCLPMAPGAG